MDLETFSDAFTRLTNFKKNRFHPLVWISGDPTIGEHTTIGVIS
jgi:hypothetical protein